MADDKRVLEAAMKLATDCGDPSRAGDVTGLFTERDIEAARLVRAQVEVRRVEVPIILLGPDKRAREEVCNSVSCLEFPMRWLIATALTCIAIAAAVWLTR